MIPRSPYEEKILRSLRRMIRAVDLHSRVLENQFGLTGPQLVCLRMIGALGPVAPSELARHVDLSQATITGIIGRLVRRQYVGRRRNAKDRRRLTISLLPAGRDLLEIAPSPLQSRFAERLAALSNDEQLAISDVLEQIVRMMDAEQLDAAAILTIEPSPPPGEPLIESRPPSPEPSGDETEY